MILKCNVVSNGNEVERAQERKLESYWSALSHKLSCSQPLSIPLRNGDPQPKQELTGKGACLLSGPTPLLQHLPPPIGCASAGRPSND